MGPCFVGTEDNPGNLESVMIVLLEQSRDKKGQRVIVKVRGKVSNANPVMLVHVSGPKRVSASWMVPCHEGSRTGALCLGVLRQGQERKGNNA